VRWQDWGYIVEAIIDTGAASPEQTQRLMANINATANAFDWSGYYNRSAARKLPILAVNNWNMIDHGVNNAMGTKSAAVLYRYGRSGRAANLAAAREAIAQQDR